MGAWGVSAVPALPSTADGLPLGTYHSTCKDCSMRGAVLHCFCIDSFDDHVPSSIKPAQCDDRYHDIASAYDGPHDGHLVCAPPYGNYQDSCRECSMTGTTLSCQCDQDNYDSVPARLDLDGCDTRSHDIWNSDGVLTCQYLDPRLPRGTYQEKCHDCKVVGADLTCTCISPYHENITSSISTTTCDLPTHDIACPYGFLECSNKKNWPHPRLPIGSYAAFCTECGVNDWPEKDTLHCDCEFFQWTNWVINHTQLVNYKRCLLGVGVSYLNGALLCL